MKMTIPGFDILAWWKMKASKYHVISFMTKDILIIYVSTVSSESAFSMRGQVLDPFRSSLGPITVEALICVQNQLKTNKQNVSDLQVELDEIEKIESSIEQQFFFFHLLQYQSELILCYNEIFFKFLELHGLTLNITIVGTILESVSIGNQDHQFLR